MKRFPLLIESALQLGAGAALVRGCWLFYPALGWLALGGALFAVGCALRDRRVQRETPKESVVIPDRDTPAYVSRAVMRALAQVQDAGARIRPPLSAS